MHPGLTLAAPILARFREDHHITRPALFRSRSKDTARAESDVDPFVEFEPAHVPGLIRLSGVDSGLSDLLDGQRVDPRTVGDLSSHFPTEVLKGAEVQHAR